MEELFSCIIAQCVELRPSQNASAPTLIFIHIQDDPPFLAGKFLQLRYLGIDGLTFSLFFGGNAGV